MKTLKLILLALTSTAILSSCGQYYEGHYWGMHWVWWFIWISFIIWIFFTPFDVPMTGKKKDSPLSILQKRYASGQMTTEEYEERKRILEKDSLLDKDRN